MKKYSNRKDYTVYGIIWVGSIILGWSIGALMNNEAVGGAMGVGLAFILTAIFCSSVYTRQK